MQGDGVGSRAQRDGAVAHDALGGIAREVDEHLLDLVCVHPHGIGGPQVELEFNVAPGQLRLEQGVQLAEQIVGGRDGKFRFGGTGEAEEVLHDVFEGGDSRCHLPIIAVR